MSEPTRWHTPLTSKGIHAGALKGCAKCARALAKKQQAQDQKAAREEELLAEPAPVAKRPSPALPTCSKCAVPILRKSKTGLCLKCFNKQRAANKKTKRKTRRCANPDCDRFIADNNKGGLCLRCHRNSEVWQKFKKEHAHWT